MKPGTSLVVLLTALLIGVVIGVAAVTAGGDDPGTRIAEPTPTPTPEPTPEPEPEPEAEKDSEPEAATAKFHTDMKGVAGTASLCRGAGKFLHLTVAVKTPRSASVLLYNDSRDKRPLFAGVRGRMAQSLPISFRRLSKFDKLAIETIVNRNRPRHRTLRAVGRASIQRLLVDMERCARSK